MKKYWIILFVLGFFACKKEDYTFKGSAFVDFPALYQKVTIKGNTNADTIVPVTIRLVGAQQGAVKNITFSVDESSTAVSGKHYTIDGTTAQIPANSNYGSIPVKFLIPSFPEQSSVKIVINLTGGDLGLNPNYKQIVVEIYRQGFMDIFTGNGGMYSCEESDVPVSIKYDVAFTQDTTTKNRILISNFWGYAKEGSFVHIDLSSQVDSVILPSQTFFDKLNREYSVSGKGKYNINDGSIALSYNLNDKNSSYSEQKTQIYKKR